ncbi:MAG TPA: HdeD family acid-resistance protein [bacterium]|nr:HdeD family acid-resistance protein [bacterium]
MLVLAQIARNWWVFVFRGVVAILFGVLAFLRPSITLEALVLLFAFWALFDGVLALIGSVGAAEAHEPWWPLVLIGLLGIAAGVATLKWPGITALALLLVIAYWSIFRGILEIVGAVRLRDLIQGEGWFIVGGLASIAFGVLLIIYPGSGLLAVVWLIGIYAVIFGIAQLMLGFRLKNLAGELPAPTPARAR